jgi:hypothetical protein
MLIRHGGENRVRAAGAFWGAGEAGRCAAPTLADASMSTSAMKAARTGRDVAVS